MHAAQPTQTPPPLTPFPREAGLALELEDVPVQSLVPEPLREVESVDEYLARLPEFDGDMEAALREAEAAGECLRFVGARERAREAGCFGWGVV